MLAGANPVNQREPSRNAKSPFFQLSAPFQGGNLWPLRAPDLVAVVNLFESRERTGIFARVTLFQFTHSEDALFGIPVGRQVGADILCGRDFKTFMQLS